MRIALTVSVTIGAAGTGGCIGLGPFSAQPTIADGPALRPELFFAGRTRGQGTLELLTGRRRSLRVEGHGHTETDGSFRLDQVVMPADGAVETRTWHLKKRTPELYTATLTDADGPVSARVTGNRFHLRYLLRKPAVYMEQDLYLEPDGRTVLNLATIRFLGIVLARLEERITRVDGRNRHEERP